MKLLLTLLTLLIASLVANALQWQHQEVLTKHMTAAKNGQVLIRKVVQVNCPEIMKYKNLNSLIFDMTKHAPGRFYGELWDLLPYYGIKDPDRLPDWSVE